MFTYFSDCWDYLERVAIQSPLKLMGSSIRVGSTIAHISPCFLLRESGSGIPNGSLLPSLLALSASASVVGIFVIPLFCGAAGSDIPFTIVVAVRSGTWLTNHVQGTRPLPA
ncbi:hypothetical protein Cni_G00043 [Canna indica]|uniref:Uncharacterized protein n=1 Tax=Canna indica TaxID=4628 RepID=A0AAQ3JLV3_9LILI|nr:hypothetical protein Cni_G00043 [Canna indica]